MNELYHFGIKGQRWGIRRYENEDGTLTELGRMRYGYKYRAKERSDIERYARSNARYENRVSEKESEKRRKFIKTSLRRAAIAGTMFAIGKKMSLNALNKEQPLFQKAISDKAKEAAKDAAKDTAKDAAKNAAKDVASGKKITLGNVLTAVAVAAPIVSVGYDVIKDMRDRKREELKNRPYYPMDLSQMSTQELNDAINRKSAEERYYQAFGVQDISSDERRKLRTLENATRYASAAQKSTSYAKMFSSTRKPGSTPAK